MVSKKLGKNCKKKEGGRNRAIDLEKIIEVVNRSQRKLVIYRSLVRAKYLIVSGE